MHKTTIVYVRLQCNNSIRFSIRPARMLFASGYIWTCH